MNTQCCLFSTWLTVPLEEFCSSSCSTASLLPLHAASPLLAVPSMLSKGVVSQIKPILAAQLNSHLPTPLSQLCSTVSEETNGFLRGREESNYLFFNITSATFSENIYSNVTHHNMLRIKAVRS